MATTTESFARKRARLASDVLDGHYAKPSVDVVAHRDLWGKLLDVINNFHLEQIGDAEPKNAHEAALCHTAMINAFNNAKDESMRYLLACMDEKHKREGEEEAKERAGEMVKGLL